MAAFLLLTVRGVPFIYQGEELGLPDSEVPDAYRHDVDSREPQRTPIAWDAPSQAKGGGFTRGEPWLPLHHLAESLNVSAETVDKDSMLTLYRRLIKLRQGNAALFEGTLTLLPAPEGVVCFARQSEHYMVVTALNFSANRASVRFALSGVSDKARLLISTDSARSSADLDLNAVEIGPYEGVALEVSPGS